MKLKYVALFVVFSAIMTLHPLQAQQKRTCTPPKCQPSPPPVQSGYVTPAAIDLCEAWDVYASASFTYWQPMQENMELGIVSDNAGADFNVSPFGINGYLVNPHASFKPGFKVGLGAQLNDDGWDTNVQYTWFRSTQETSTTLDSAAAPSTVLYPTWTLTSVNAFVYLSYYAATQKWRLNMDLLDWELGRSGYVGKQLSVRPFFAIRAAWIRQGIDVGYFHENLDLAPNADHFVLVSKTSHSWALGPRAGLNTNWMIGEGFRLYGNGAADLLFTRYTKLRSQQQSYLSTGTPIAGQAKFVDQNSLDCLRAHLDLEFGIGWGSYFCNNRCHADLSAGYNIQMFCHQNMFRHFTDSLEMGNSISTNGDLYLQGLTATARFDF